MEGKEKWKEKTTGRERGMEGIEKWRENTTAKKRGMGRKRVERKEDWKKRGTGREREMECKEKKWMEGRVEGVRGLEETQNNRTKKFRGKRTEGGK